MLSRVTFDEKVISEHDLDRGTRQRIDEPPTPYCHSPASSHGGTDDDDQHAHSTLSDVPGRIRGVNLLLEQDVASALSGGWGDAQAAGYTGEGTTGNAAH